MNVPEKSKLEYLWKSFQKGDDKSFSIIYQQHIGSLLLYGSKLSHDRELVRDCIQEIFVNLFLKRKKRAGKSSILSPTCLYRFAIVLQKKQRHLER